MIFFSQKNVLEIVSDGMISNVIKGDHESQLIKQDKEKLENNSPSSLDNFGLSNSNSRTLNEISIGKRNIF